VVYEAMDLKIGILFNYSKFQPTVGNQKEVCKVINHTYMTAEFTFARIQQNTLAEMLTLQI